MEIPHATLTQVRTGKNGRRITVEADVLEVARQIREIDPALSVHFNEEGSYYEVRELVAKNAEYAHEREEVVTTVPADGLNANLVHYIRYLDSHRQALRLADRLERDEKKREKAEDDAFTEELSEPAERMAHAVRKDLDHQGKAFVPKEV